ncbi:MAG: PspC domain-containing protein [Bacteroidia bacterium]|nr:PspC domain-containing protein [Bacteroidia bacterium]
MHRVPSKSKSDKLILGVAGGLARQWGASPFYVRLAFILAGFFSAGLAILFYLALAFIMPDDK